MLCVEFPLEAGAEGAFKVGECRIGLDEPALTHEFRVNELVGGVDLELFVADEELFHDLVILSSDDGAG